LKPARNTKGGLKQNNRRSNNKREIWPYS